MLELFKRIRSRREGLGIKSRSSINKIEMGKNDITQSKIMEIAKALNTTPEYLMGWVSTLTTTAILTIILWHMTGEIQSIRTYR